MNDFDLLKSPLEGTNLIEASAGTGKTYAITGIFLRLVLEMELGVERILVVTFTRDATAELRDRIRGALKNLLALVETPGGNPAGEKFLQQLAAQCSRDRSRREHAVQRLSEALRNFDQASISTIHGFCRRVLQENAFESAAPFDTELITDQQQLIREVVEDFWRRNFYQVFPEVMQCAQQQKMSPAFFRNLLGSHPSPVRLNIVPRVEPQDERLERLIPEFRKRFQALRRAWPPARDEVGELLEKAGLHGGRYGKTIPHLLNKMDDYLASPEPELPLNFKDIVKFTPECLEASKTKQSVVPSHSFFDLCGDFLISVEAVKEAAGRHLLHLKGRLFSYLQEELAERKRLRNVQFYDDLLQGMQQAVEGKTSRALIHTLREKYRAVLIDEFQDTDPIQYTVFSKVFVEGGSRLFLIGDPKQAIYGFRGADIFAYRSAAQQVKTVYSLGRNWRSEAELVQAVNAIFSGVERPFAFDWIDFRRAKAARESAREELTLEGRNTPPFQLWFMDADKMEAGFLDRAGFIKKPQARILACRAAAAEISRLLNLAGGGRAMLGSKPLRAGDIAVLVRRNKDAELMRQALAELNVPAVLNERIHLFDTPEALEMERLLAAVARPHSDRLLRAALTTDILGLGGDKLAGLIEDERGLEDWLVRFEHYNLTWQSHGFMRMFAELVSRENVRTSLLAFADGERRLTNLLQLTEVLHRRWVESRPGVTGLVKWLSEQRDPNSARPEELKLRLETDEGAVKLATIHGSKGLEYPVVFCPMPWDQSIIGNKDKPLQFHDSELRFTLDLGSENRRKNRELAQTELLAENLRLLYVSLTRARNRCYMIWGRINKSWTSAAAYLFHGKGRGEQRESVDALGDRVKSLSSKQIYQDLEILTRSAGGSIELGSLPSGPGEPYRPGPLEREKPASRSFAGRIEHEWKISSFSSLISGKAREIELPDRDALAVSREEPLPEPQEPAGIFAFPRGTKAGNFFHGLLERLDFTESDPQVLDARVAEELKLYGFDTGWKKEVRDLLGRLLSLPLGSHGETFSLSRTAMENRLNELEFYCPLKSVTPERLKSIFASYGAGLVADRFPERIGRLSFSPVRGFLKGFIDLVLRHGRRFYLVDWKSNYLGGRVEDYRPEALAASMNSEFYILQYHLYTLALDRYLRVRLPDYDYSTHFGGVYYIFLRGVDPESDPRCGLFYDLPPAELIGELNRVLINRNY